MDRRAILKWAAGAWATAGLSPGPRQATGRIVGASHAVGHLLRDGAPRTSSAPPERADLVVVGSGVSGLSAAWRAAAAGVSSIVLELEPFVGGTSTSDEANGTPYPWGAHYVAAPNVEARAALRLLEAIGAVTGWDAANRPTFDPLRLCHAPSERLFWRGAWIEGLFPDDLDREDAAEVARFAQIEEDFFEREGSDGRPAFTIPIERSSRDPDLLALDRMSMSAWLDREGFRSPFLRWMVRYACLDDFGGEPDDISAWAGLHYFAARKLRSAELAGSHFLVWPEGNGRLVRALVELGRPSVRTGALATAIEPTRDGAMVHFLDVERGEARRIAARAVVVATPAFVARRLLASAPALPDRAASPWLVANLHVDWPFDPDRAWDSVLYDGEGLGYVDARHQMTELKDGTVLTYYRAYGGADVRGTRAALLGATWDDLATAVVRDLAPAHPGLRASIDRLDLMVWGHAMPRPRPGFLGDSPFEAPVLLAPNVGWAHVDQSGVALFEEALGRGVRAAEALAPALGASFGESWM